MGAGSVSFASLVVVRGGHFVLQIRRRQTSESKYGVATKKKTDVYRIYTPACSQKKNILIVITFNDMSNIKKIYFIEVGRL